ncbi:MAG: hypothetical protein D8M18_08355 [Bacteroidetes bacterium]|nr:hypothetical protein [Bacteroidota bacterium]GIK68767.1 MAG: hypothetical protein BroJett020_00620 [Bacteroidota bacterium]
MTHATNSTRHCEGGTTEAISLFCAPKPAITPVDKTLYVKFAQIKKIYDLHHNTITFKYLFLWIIEYHEM